MTNDPPWLGAWQTAKRDATDLQASLARLERSSLEHANEIRHEVANYLSDDIDLTEYCPMNRTELEGYFGTLDRLHAPENWDRDGIINDVANRQRIDSDMEAAAVIDWLLAQLHYLKGKNHERESH